MLIRNQLLLLDKTPKGSRYSNELKQFALIIYLLGPKAYSKLGKVIRLPSPSTLKRITQHWQIYPGFNEFVFKILELRVPLMSEKSKDCIICIDEMSIKSNLFYNISTDHIVGFAELHNKRSTDIATSALVIMVRGISYSWKQPVSYFFTKNSTNVEDLTEIIFEAVRKLKSIGLNILAITSDQGPNFLKLVKSNLKLTVEKPYFFVDNTPIFYLFDVPHLLKSTRNNFFSYDFKLDDGVTKKCYLDAMYNLDKTKQFRLAPKLTDDHLNPNAFKKMRVKLASQVLSHSVAVAMHTYIDFGKIPEEARTTANFISTMNKLFDILNSSTLESYQAFMGTAKQIQFLNKMDDMFSSLKVIQRRKDKNNEEKEKDVTNTLKFIYGWRLTISSILKLWEVLQKKNYKFLFTRNLNQDCLENYFGQIRNACGNARNPTPIQFARAFKKLFALRYCDEKEGSNCLEDANDILVTITPDLLKKTEFLNYKTTEKSRVLNIETNDYQNLLTEEGNALVYVGGYFLRKCLFKHTCATCTDFCNSQTSDQSTIFCEKKAYDGNQGRFGGLTVPPKNFTEFMLSMENTFSENFSKFCAQDSIGNNLKSKFSSIPFTHPCPNFPAEYLVSLYTRVRIYYTLKFANRELKCQKQNSEHPKLKILKNL